MTNKRNGTVNSQPENVDADKDFYLFVGMNARKPKNYGRARPYNNSNKKPKLGIYVTPQQQVKYTADGVLYRDPMNPGIWLPKPKPAIEIIPTRPAKKLPKPIVSGESRPLTPLEASKYASLLLTLEQAGIEPSAEIMRKIGGVE